MDIERIQKIVLKIILGQRYENYEQACQLLRTTTLQQRRQTLSLRFALACLKNPQHSHLFKPTQDSHYSLRNIKTFEEPLCHTSRYFKSPIPTMTRMLNEYFKKRDSGMQSTEISNI